MTSRFRSKGGSAAMGYRAGAGGTVTQATNRTTAVTINKLAGQITTHNASLAAEASADFVVNNNLVELGDIPVVAIASGSNSTNTAVTVVGVAAGSFTLKVSNNEEASGTAETGAILINFAVIKGALT